MQLLDVREPVSTWSHCPGLMLALPGTLFLWRRSGGDHGKRLALLVYGFSLAFCYLASSLYHGVQPPRACRRLRPPGWSRDLRPDRRELHPVGMVPDARPMAAMDPCRRLDDDRHGDGSDRDWQALLPASLHLRFPGDGMGCCLLLFRDRAVRAAPLPDAGRRRWTVLQRGRGAQPAAGPLSGRGSSGSMNCSTCSCWPAVWLTTGSFSRSWCRLHNSLERFLAMTFTCLVNYHSKNNSLAIPIPRSIIRC